MVDNTNSISNSNSIISNNNRSSFNNNSDNNSFETLFYKVIHNKYLFNYIIDKIKENGIEYQDLEIYRKKYRIKWSKIKSIDWMIEKNQLELLKLKLLYESKNLTFNSKSKIIKLIQTCRNQDHQELFKLLYSKLVYENLLELIQVSCEFNNMVSLAELFKEFYHHKIKYFEHSNLILGSIKKYNLDILKLFIQYFGSSCDTITDGSNSSGVVNGYGYCGGSNNSGGVNTCAGIHISGGLNIGNGQSVNGGSNNIGKINELLLEKDKVNVFKLASENELYGIEIIKYLIDNWEKLHLYPHLVYTKIPFNFILKIDDSKLLLKLLENNLIDRKPSDKFYNFHLLRKSNNITPDNIIASIYITFKLLNLHSRYNNIPNHILEKINKITNNSSSNNDVQVCNQLLELLVNEIFYTKRCEFLPSVLSFYNNPTTSTTPFTSSTLTINNEFKSIEWIYFDRLQFEKWVFENFNINGLKLLLKNQFLVQSRKDNVNKSHFNLQDINKDQIIEFTRLLIVDHGATDNTISIQFFIFITSICNNIQLKFILEDDKFKSFYSKYKCSNGSFGQCIDSIDSIERLELFLKFGFENYQDFNIRSLEFIQYLVNLKPNHYDPTIQILKLLFSAGDDQELKLTKEFIDFVKKVHLKLDYSRTDFSCNNKSKLHLLVPLFNYLNESLPRYITFPNLMKNVEIIIGQFSFEEFNDNIKIQFKKVFNYHCFENIFYKSVFQNKLNNLKLFLENQIVEITDKLITSNNSPYTILRKPLNVFRLVENGTLKSRYQFKDIYQIFQYLIQKLPIDKNKLFFEYLYIFMLQSRGIGIQDVVKIEQIYRKSFIVFNYENLELFYYLLIKSTRLAFYVLNISIYSNSDRNSNKKIIDKLYNNNEITVLNNISLHDIQKKSNNQILNILRASIFTLNNDNIKILDYNILKLLNHNQIHSNNKINNSSNK